MAGVGRQLGAMLIIRQHKRAKKTGPHGTFQTRVLTFGLIALLIYLPSRVQAAAERRVQIGFATHPANPDLILACSHYGQLFASSDGGEWWVKLPREFTEVRGALAWVPN